MDLQQTIRDLGFELVETRPGFELYFAGGTYLDVGYGFAQFRTFVRGLDGEPVEIHTAADSNPPGFVTRLFDRLVPSARSLPLRDAGDLRAAAEAHAARVAESRLLPIRDESLPPLELRWRLQEEITPPTDS